MAGLKTNVIGAFAPDTHLLTNLPGRIAQAQMLKAIAHGLRNVRVGDLASNRGPEKTNEFTAQSLILCPL